MVQKYSLVYAQRQRHSQWLLQREDHRNCQFLFGIGTLSNCRSKNVFVNMMPTDHCRVFKLQLVTHWQFSGQFNAKFTAAYVSSVSS